MLAAQTGEVEVEEALRWELSEVLRLAGREATALLLVAMAVLQAQMEATTTPWAAPLISAEQGEAVAGALAATDKQAVPVSGPRAAQSGEPATTEEEVAQAAG